MKHLFCYFALPIGYLIYCCAMLGEQSHISTVLIWFLFELIVELCIVLILTTKIEFKSTCWPSFAGFEAAGGSLEGARLRQGTPGIKAEVKRNRLSQKKFGLSQPMSASGGYPRPKLKEAKMFLRWAWPKLSFDTSIVGMESIPYEMGRGVKGL